MKPLILVSGKQGSGKTTLITELRKQRKVATVKFADPLYEMHEFILNKMQTWTGEPRIVKDGALLQLLGTEWGRKHRGDNVWVDICKKKIDLLRQASLAEIIAIDDCRFENEFDAFPDALTVRLECPEEVRKQRMEHGWRDNTSHASETGLDKYAKDGKFDLVIPTDRISARESAKLILEALEVKPIVLVKGEANGEGLPKPK